MKYFLLLMMVFNVIGCSDCCGNKNYLSGEGKADVYLSVARGRGKKIGEINFKDVDGGVMVDVELSQLSLGEHGFHIHEFGDCRATFHRDGKIVMAGKAGGHFDIYKTMKHKGPNGGGHIGDLPKLEVDKNGEVIDRFFVENISVNMIKGRAVVVHEGGDNYSDEPVVLGGGGDRVACGVIE